MFSNETGDYLPKEISEDRSIVHSREGLRPCVKIALETPIDAWVRMHATYLAVISCIRKWWDWKSKFRTRQDLRTEPRGLLTFK